MSQVITSTISDKMADYYQEWEDTFGIGPCGAFAALKREQGWGEIAVCTASDEIGSFPHYVIWDAGIIDLTNPFDHELTYTDIEILDADEMPEAVNDAMLTWLRDRGI